METKTITLNGLLKIGQEKHIKDLQKYGTIFCNSIKKFREFETEDLNRKDAREGAHRTEYLNPSTMKILIDDKELPIEFISAKLSFFDKNLENHKLYCLYGFKTEHIHGKPFIDKRNCRFGNKALLISNVRQFITRIKAKLEKLDLEYKYDWVSYYNEEEINYGLSVFNKPDFFEYQSEFRFYIKHKNPEPLKISIGSINDISMILDVKDLPKINLKSL